VATRREVSIERYRNRFSGIELTFTRKGLEVGGYYDSIVGLEGGLIPWDEIDAARAEVFRRERS
jgi:hypothetical protein